MTDAQLRLRSARLVDENDARSRRRLCLARSARRRSCAGDRAERLLGHLLEVHAREIARDDERCLARIEHLSVALRHGVPIEPRDRLLDTAERPAVRRLWRV